MRTRNALSKESKRNFEKNETGSKLAHERRKSGAPPPAKERVDIKEKKGALKETTRLPKVDTMDIYSLYTGRIK